MDLVEEGIYFLFSMLRYHVHLKAVQGPFSTSLRLEGGSMLLNGEIGKMHQVVDNVFFFYGEVSNRESGES